MLIKQQKPKGEKMKKTLLSVIAGLAVINVASAVPSPADRKALCEKHPDKYVWVDKTQACIPNNPCKDDYVGLEGIMAYCYSDIALPRDPFEAEKWVNRYVEKNLHTTVVGFSRFAGGDPNYYSVSTADGNFFAAFRVTPNYLEGSTRQQYYAALAIHAYGHDENSPFQVKSEQECKDIADFASLLSDELIESKYESGICTVPYNKYKNL